MPSTRAATPAQTGAGDLLPLWFGILGPPVIWAIRIGTSYVLVPYVCAWGSIWVLHLVTLAGLAGAAGAGSVAWTQWRRAGGGSEVGAGGRTTRTRFMGLIGMFSAAFFFLVMVAEGLANVFLDPCRTAGVPLA